MYIGAHIFVSYSPIVGIYPINVFLDTAWSDTKIIIHHTVKKRVALLQLQNNLHGINDLVLDGLGGCNNTLVRSQSPTFAEIQSVTVDICHLAASLTDNEISGSMIPDLLLVVLLHGQTQVNVTCASGDRAVLGLRVESHTGVGDSQALSDSGVVSLGGVGSLDTFTEDGLGDVRHGVHGNRLLVGEGTAAKRTANGSFTLDGREEHTLTSTIILVGTDSGGKSSIFHRQVGASNSSHLHIAVLHQTQTNGILAPTEETLGAVDGVQRPDAALSSSLALALIDDVQHRLFTGQRASQHTLAVWVLQLDVLGEFPDLGAQRLVFAEGTSLLLGHDLIVREVLADSLNDQGLGSEVADGNGRFVVFGHGALGLLMEHLLSEDGRALDGELGDKTFLLVRHVGSLGIGGGRGGDEVGDESGEPVAGFKHNVVVVGWSKTEAGEKRMGAAVSDALVMIVFCLVYARVGRQLKPSRLSVSLHSSHAWLLNRCMKHSQGDTRHQSRHSGTKAFRQKDSPH